MSSTSGSGSGARARTLKSRLTFRGVLLRLALFLATVVMALALPFVALLGIATTLYSDYGWHHGIAIGVGVLAASLVVMFYAHYLAVRLGFGRVVTVSRARTAGVLVVAYLVWALIYVSAANVKSPEVRSAYRSAHPLLRLAVATLVVFDGDAVITDLARSPEDYARMGLPPLERSLHYRQEDGYVHALDLRTRGRSELRNAAAATYFRLLGFRTLRHVGTADHLHVSLPVRDRTG